MSDGARPPIAIRSLRPYTTEEDFLAEERDTLSRTAITLIGAPSRPRGVVIRFELTLSDGTPLVRGEGRVLGFQAADDQGPSSLTLRFTRLDAKSKALVDRAAAYRESGAPPAVETETAARDTEPPVYDGGSAANPPLGGELADAPLFDRISVTDEDPLASTSAGETVPPSLAEPPPSLPSDDELTVSLSSPTLPPGEAEEIGPVRRHHGNARVLSDEQKPPMSFKESDAARRDGLLDRLRSRAKTLSPTQIAAILTPRGPGSH